jgi:hypothetical protein
VVLSVVNLALGNGLLIYQLMLWRHSAAGSCG